MPEEKFRLVTRADFDGLVCAALLRHLELIDDIKFAHPKDMQDGTVEITEQDITTNLPYVQAAYLAFDHHLSESLRITHCPSNHVIDPTAPSAARVVYDYYGGLERFPLTWDEMMAAVDKSDSADFECDEILFPRSWALLSFLMDSRTGLGRFHNFKVSNYQLMMDLIDYCRFRNIDDILAVPDVAERVKLYFKHEADFKEQIRRCTTVLGDVAVLDLRNEVTVFPGNRFMIYALYPQCRVSMTLLWGRHHLNTVIALGKSILDRSSPANIGELMLGYGGGGHEAAGTCQVANEQADRIRDEIIGQVAAASISAPLLRGGLARSA